MKKTKRILALLGAASLILLYLSTLIFALLDTPFFQDLLRASVAATILIPVLLYGFLLFCRLTDSHTGDDDGDNGDDSED